MNAEKLVAAVMAVRDASHDTAHAFRVRDLALSLTKEEGLEDHILEIVELAALLHDIRDYKYTKDGTEDTKVVQTFLRNMVLWIRDGEDYKASFVAISSLKMNLGSAGPNGIKSGAGPNGIKSGLRRLPRSARYRLMECHYSQLCEIWVDGCH